MHLGVMIEGQEGLNWERWREICRRVEALGFESLWRSDHFFSLQGHSERDALETMVSLTLTAAETRRLRFGPLVTSMTFRHPALLARMAAAIDQLSGGRFILGVGAGWNVPEHQAFGIPFPPLKQRMDMLEEGIRVIQALCNGSGRDSVSGRHFSLDHAEMHPRPSQQPLPLLIGGSGERRTLRMVARYADEWNLIGTPERVREKSAVLEQHCEREGRDPATITRSVMAGFLIGASDAEVTRRLTELRSVNSNLPAVDDATLKDQLRGRGWLVGTPEQIAEQLGELAAVGVQRVMLQHHLMTDFEALELIAATILPVVSG